MVDNICSQLVVCVQILKEIQGGNKVEADCEAINNASSFGVSSMFNIYINLNNPFSS